MNTDQRLTRLERAVGEVTHMLKGSWVGPPTSAASQILAEQAELDRRRLEAEDRVRTEEQAAMDAKVEARLGSSV